LNQYLFFSLSSRVPHYTILLWLLHFEPGLVWKKLEGREKNWKFTMPPRAAPWFEQGPRVESDSFATCMSHPCASLHHTAFITAFW
jgi:hypothetical protein